MSVATESLFGYPTVTVVLLLNARRYAKISAANLLPAPFDEIRLAPGVITAFVRRLHVSAEE